jgi:RnfABCDGE-type electron transport complex D subunit
MGLKEKIYHFFERVHHQLKEQKREGLAVVWEGFKDAIFGGSDKVARQAPYIRDAIGMQRYMGTPLIACIPLVLAAIYSYGWSALAIILITYLVGGIVEVAFCAIRRHEITEGLLVTCMLYALSLPPTLGRVENWWMIAVGIAVAIVIKEIFGGSGYNIFNPAITGRAFLLLAFPSAMTTSWYLPFNPLKDGLGGFLHWSPETAKEMVDAIAKATPLAAYKAPEILPTDLFSLITGIGRADSLGAGFPLLLLLGGIYMLHTRVIDWRVSLVMIATAGVTSQFLHFIFPMCTAEIKVCFPDGLYAMLSGGLLFAAFLNATDPVTSPMTRRGKWIFGIMLGVLTVLGRGLTGYAEWVTFAILIGNMFTPLLDRFTVPKAYAGPAISKR